jgi:hypothetical protein
MKESYRKGVASDGIDLDDAAGSPADRSECEQDDEVSPKGIA